MDASPATIWFYDRMQKRLAYRDPDGAPRKFIAWPLKFVELVARANHNDLCKLPHVLT